MKILFITWDGPQTFYLESLFLPIFQKLKESQFDFYVLQFSWGMNSQQVEQRRNICAEFDIPFRYVSVWRKPIALGSLVTAINGAIYVRKFINDYDIELIMPRCTLPALASLLAIRKGEEKILFDADGLPLDERVDFGGWTSTSLQYRILRYVEDMTVRNADGVMVRTEKAKKILMGRAGADVLETKFSTVINGRDETIFRPVTKETRLKIRKRLGIGGNDLVLVYCGSIGDQYCMKEMLDLFCSVRRKKRDSWLLILTGSKKEAECYVRKYLAESHRCIITRVPPDDIPDYVGSSDVGLALRQPTFSMKGVAPIKLGEYLLCGVPVIATAGIGDTLECIDSDVGCILERHDEVALEQAADWIVTQPIVFSESLRMNCRQRGLEFFTLTQAALSYKKAIENTLQ